MAVFHWAEFSARSGISLCLCALRHNQLQRDKEKAQDELEVIH